MYSLISETPLNGVLNIAETKIVFFKGNCINIFNGYIWF